MQSVQSVEAVKEEEVVQVTTENEEEELTATYIDAVEGITWESAETARTPLAKRVADAKEKLRERRAQRQVRQQHKQGERAKKKQARTVRLEQHKEKFKVKTELFKKNFVPVFKEYFLLEDVLPNCKTGDIVLLHGTEYISRAIEVSTMSYWSHCAILIRNPSDNIKKLYNVEQYVAKAEAYGLSDIQNDEVYLFESDTETMDQREGGGVQLLPFRLWLRDTMEYYGVDPVMAVRMLVVPDITDDNSTDYPELEKFIEEIAFRGYKVPKRQLIGSVHKRNKVEDLSSVFCSELVAATLKSMGLLEKDHSVSSNYVPKDFSSLSFGLKHKGNSFKLVNTLTFVVSVAVSSFPFSFIVVPFLFLSACISDCFLLPVAQCFSGARDQHSLCCNAFSQSGAIIK
ncbi:DUF4261 domain-containing protein [Balamuthia mandrillaris]